jgi:nucleoside-diphosphate-sugar epimerase
MPHPKAPAVFNVGSGQSQTLRDLIQRVVEELALPVSLSFGARPYGPFEPMHLVADISRARLELGWKPQHNLAHAVWQLARDSFPDLKLKQPQEFV